MNHITIILLPNMMMSSISLPLEMLNAAASIRYSQSKNSRKMDIALAALGTEPVTTSSGLSITPNTQLEKIEHTDLVIIPALWRNPLHTINKNLAACEWINNVAAKNTLICAVGTGSSLLAEANILDEKAATTHWFYFDFMEKKYPKVKWKRQHLITQSGNFYCAGSVNSIADLTIHFIEKGFSTAIAKRVESQFSPEIRQSYDSHLFDESPNTRHTDEAIVEIQDYIREHFNETIDLEHLAKHSQIAYRTLLRRFKLAAGCTPLQFQQYLRAKHGRDLLKNTNLSIQEISDEVGYVDASHFSQIFSKHYSQTPNNFRKSVRGKLFNSRQ